MGKYNSDESSTVDSYKHEDPLYIWKINKDSGKISKHVVTEYKVINSWGNNIYSVYAYGISTIRESRLNIFHENRVVMLEDNDEEAFRILRQGLEQRASKQQKGLEATLQLYFKFIEANMGEVADGDGEVD